jgi:hypothetical protein
MPQLVELLPSPVVREREGSAPQAWESEGLSLAQRDRNSIARASHNSGEGGYALAGKFWAHRYRPNSPAGRTASVISRNPNATAGAQDGP